MTVIVCGALCLSHLAFSTIPREQKLILRIAALPAICAVCDVLSIAFYQKAQFLDPIPILAEAVAICALFELRVFYVATGSITERDLYFQNFERRGRFRVKNVKHNKGSLRWFKVTWLCVFQYLFVSIVVFIVNLIGATMQCPLTPRGKRLILITKVVSAIFVTFAVISVIGFGRHLSTEMKPITAFPKLLALKLLVAVDFVQSLIFVGIQKSGIGANKTPHLSYYDLIIGLSNMLFEIEMTVLSLFFIWVFSLTRYRQALSVSDLTNQVARRNNPFMGLLQALNPIDVIWGLFSATKVLVRLPFGKKFLSHQAKDGVEYSTEHKAKLSASPKSNQPNLMYPSPQPVAYPPQTVQQRSMV